MSLEDEQLWPEIYGDLPDWELVRDFMAREGTFPKKQVIILLRKTLELLRKEPNLVKLAEPICVVGDIHG